MNALQTGAAAIAALAFCGTVLAEDWTIRLTVDNQYAAYFGTSTATTGFIGTDGDWPTLETYNVTGRASTDYLYIAAVSDFATAQGLLASFTNQTTGNTVLTGSDQWQVFRAGDYLQQLFGTSGPWPINSLPNASQIDTAVAYATANNLWTGAATAAGFTNPGAGPWDGFPQIAGSASWIWAPSPDGSNPLEPGSNQGEFLVFRISGQAVPTPGAAAVIALGGLLATRRRRERF